ncbi:MAG: YqiA/YcfP family alpha/beta fold hydrolase [Burkholderiaceae bacterium]
MILYLHGFRSSPKSFKAQLLADAMATQGIGNQWVCPQLPASPQRAVELAGHLIEQAQLRQNMQPESDLCIIGSSLGGYYANYLAEHWKCRAVVLNPAVYAARDLATQVGEHSQYHSDDPFVFLPEYVDELAALAVGKPSRPDRFYLLATQGDEVLDWREMVAWYQGCRQHVVPGGDHGISDFARYLDDVLEFALAPQQKTQ